MYYVYRKKGIIKLLKVQNNASSLYFWTHLIAAMFLKWLCGLNLRLAYDYYLIKQSIS